MLLAMGLIFVIRNFEYNVNFWDKTEKAIKLIRLLNKIEKSFKMIWFWIG